VDATPQVYMPLVPRPGSTNPAATFAVGYVSFVLRTSGSPAAVVPAVDAALARLSPVPSGRQASRVFVIEDAFRNITAERRFNARLMTVLGGLALVIGIAGVYGVMSSVVAQRTREIGVRVALGATEARIRRHVLAQAAWTLVVGLAIGLPAAWGLTRTFGSIYFGITPSHLAVYVGVAALLGATGVLAAALPARRASRVDPIVALRD
jgi:ABC-type antimicrobial peptide transport system permease subunit